MDLLNIIFGGGHFEIQYGRRAKCILLYSSSLPVRKVYQFNSIQFNSIHFILSREISNRQH